MGDTFEIEDVSGGVRIVGPIVDPGATAGGLYFVYFAVAGVWD